MLCFYFLTLHVAFHEFYGGLTDQQELLAWNIDLVRRTKNT